MAPPRRVRRVCILPCGDARQGKERDVLAEAPGFGFSENRPKAVRRSLSDIEGGVFAPVRIMRSRRRPSWGRDGDDISARGRQGSVLGGLRGHRSAVVRHRFDRRGWNARRDGPKASRWAERPLPGRSRHGSRTACRWRRCAKRGCGSFPSPRLLTGHFRGWKSALRVPIRSFVPHKPLLRRGNLWSDPDGYLATPTCGRGGSPR